jgi:hypothetical protein
VNVVTFLTRVLQQRRSSLRRGRRLAIRTGGRWADGGLKRCVRTASEVPSVRTPSDEDHELEASTY